MVPFFAHSDFHHGAVTLALSVFNVLWTLITRDLHHNRVGPLTLSPILARRRPQPSLRVAMAIVSFNALLVGYHILALISLPQSEWRHGRG